MPELSSIPPRHPDEGEPFIIEETISVYAAATVYRNRHPVSGFLKLAKIQDRKHIKMLEHWIGRREPRVPETLSEVGAEFAESGEERDWRICWEVYCELVAGINDGTITVAHIARDQSGQIIPIACKIWTRDLLNLARKRGDAGTTLTALANANAINDAALADGEPEASEPEREKPGDLSAPSEPQDQPVAESPPRLRTIEVVMQDGKEEYPNVLQRARELWPDLTKLPNREGLLAWGKKEFAHFGWKHARYLRNRLGPDESKKGGARMHKRRQFGNR
jgi:hypothetical protein